MDLKNQPLPTITHSIIMAIVGILAITVIFSSRNSTTISIINEHYNLLMTISVSLQFIGALIGAVELLWAKEIHRRKNNIDLATKNIKLKNDSIFDSSAKPRDKYFSNENFKNTNLSLNKEMNKLQKYENNVYFFTFIALSLFGLSALIQFVVYTN